MILLGNAVRTLDTQKDWTLGNSSAGYLQKNAAIAQQINCRIIQLLSECFWDAGAGLNWYGFLQSKNPQGLSLAISTVILNTVNVKSVNSNSFTLDHETRLFSVRWAVDTIFSRNLTGSIQVPV